MAMNFYRAFCRSDKKPKKIFFITKYLKNMERITEIFDIIMYLN